MKFLVKLKDYIKFNKFYIAVMFIGFAALALQMNSVILYADDFSLGIISKTSGLSGAFSHFIEHYMSWGGGLTALIATIFLMFDITVWKIFNCILIFITVIMSVRMITYGKKVNKGFIALIIWICIYLLNIYISRETLYWLDGSLAYVFSGFQVFIFFYYLYAKLILKTKEKKYDYLFLPLVAFFAGWSSAQTGVLAVLIPIILFVWVKFFKKEKIKPLYIISALLALVGFLIFYFAPGNSSRMAVFTEFANLNILQKIIYRVDAVYGLIFDFRTYPLTGTPFYLLLTMRLHVLYKF